jgi:beta-lactam-binding protein with PASTA domain
MEIATEGLPVQDFAPDPSGINAYYLTPRIDVPDVIGLPYWVAEQELLKAGLFADIRLVNSTAPVDTVVATIPGPGSRILQGLRVQLEVSNGIPPEANMPNLIGYSADQAEVVLLQLQAETGIGFSWSYVAVPVYDQTLERLVISTSPGPGGLVVDGMIITLNTGSYVPPGTG